MSSDTRPESDLPDLDPILEQASRLLLPDAGSWAPVGGRSFLARGLNGEQHVRVRRWPEGTAPERVRFVHRLQEVIIGYTPTLCARPYVSTATGQSSILIDGTLVDVQEWIPGKPELGRAKAQELNGHTVHRPVALGAEQYARLVTSVATIHRSSEDLATSRFSPHAPIDQALKAIDQAWGAARVRLRPSAPSTPPIQRWLRLGEQALPAANTTIRGVDWKASPAVIAHLSLWPGHVLIDRDGQLSLLDFSAAVATTSMLDVAHLVTRFAGWTGDNAELVLGHYTDIRPLSPQERRALPAFAALDLVLESARLLRLGYTGVVPQSSREAVSARAGAQDLLNSLEAVLPAVLRGDMPVPFVKRRKLASIKRTANEQAIKTRKRKR